NFLKGTVIKRLTLAAFFIAACTLPVKNIIEGYNPKYSNFINVAAWLNINAPDGSVLGVDDIGILRYHYKKGKLVDALGLINPEVSEHLSKKDFDWFLNHFKPDFIAHEYPDIQAHLRGNKKTFWKSYKVVKVFESRGQKIGIYQRISSLSLIE
ncbi:MAG: hypothetical protein Q8M94_18100, partial [Ignavibacteria bacterium]|nr:hypothetical protein [Ignavibacteria bacterium]